MFCEEKNAALFTLPIILLTQRQGMGFELENKKYIFF